MKERPILFNTANVRVILDGRKTMTRRVIKWDIKLLAVYPDRVEAHFIKDDMAHFCNDFLSHCPYGQVGDRLWVRETFVLESDAEYGYSEDEIKRIGVDKPIKSEISDGDYYHLIPHYRATEPEPNIVPPWVDDFDDKTRWTPSIFMPRWASRLTLEITGVRVERVQEITEEDAIKEGAPAGYISAYPTIFHKGQPNYTETPKDYRMGFQRLWNSLNAKRGYGWDTNPWVWVIEFKVSK